MERRRRRDRRHRLLERSAAVTMVLACWFGILAGTGLHLGAALAGAALFTAVFVGVLLALDKLPEDLR